MGNQQSKQAHNRPSNRLSKPKTNSYSNAIFLNARAIHPPSRRNSVSTNGFPTKFQNSTVFSEAGEAEKEEPKKRKRMSFFRSRSSWQKIVSNLELHRGTEKYLANQSPPVDLPVRQWSRPRGTGVQSMPPSRRASLCNPPPEMYVFIIYLVFILTVI